MFDSVSGRPLGMRQLGVQEVDICSIVRPITKYAETVLEPERIKYHLEKAVYLALNGRPGPVWVDIPLDVQAISIDTANLVGFDPVEFGDDGRRRTAPDLHAEVTKVIAALNACERPILFAGNGIRLAKAEAEFKALRDHLRIPTVATWCAADLVPSDDPTYVGRPGSVAARGANFALQNSDFLLAVGVRLDFAITGYAPQNLAREAYKVAVDIDAAELYKLQPHLQQPICADARDFLNELLSRKHEIQRRVLSPWLTRCADWKTRYPVVTAEHRKPEGLVSIFNLAEVLGTQVSAQDRLVVGNSGSAIEIYLLACPTVHSQRLYHTAGLGAMGYAIPMAIAVAIANPGREVIAVDGDGGFMFNIQELETIRRLNLPIKFFVLNNDGYSSIRASQRAHFGKASIGADRDSGLTIPDLTKVGAGFGLGTYRIENQTDLRAEVRRVLDMAGPVVCDVRVLPDEVRAPRLQSQQRSDGSFVSRPLEDLYPFLPREEFLANMIVEPLPESLTI
jgi:acetolactate synthase-1/2/3 large subunit